MKLKTLMIINAIVAAIFGITFVLLPSRMIAYYGTMADAPMRLMGQLYGAALISFAVLTWTARKSPVNEARKAITLALFIGHGIGFLVALFGQLGDVVNSLGWSTVAIYFLFSLGFGFFHFSKSS